MGCTTWMDVEATLSQGFSTTENESICNVTLTLRNIAVTHHLHDGSVDTLEDLIDLYAAGGRLIEDGLNAGDGTKHPNKSAFIVGFELRTPRKRPAGLPRRIDRQDAAYKSCLFKPIRQ